MTPTPKKLSKEAWLRKILRCFRQDGQEITLTPGQFKIFRAIVLREHKRVQILTTTQYGKSYTVALACVILTCLFKEKVCVVAPTNEKAALIMRYYIEHLKDHPFFFNKLRKDTKLERLEQDENKTRVMLNNGGGIFIISCQAGNSQKGIEAAMGSGAKNVIADESGLIPDTIEATIFRMIAGKGPDALYCKIGNPFYRNHFYKTSKSLRYHQIFIDYHQAIAEGRYTQEFIDEAKGKPFFSVLYECKFPADNEQDELGYTRLLTDEHIEQSQIKKDAEDDLGAVIPFAPKGIPRLGVDFGEGGDPSAFVIRYDNYAKVLETNRDPDLMAQVGRVRRYMQEYNISNSYVFFDDIGIGSGPSDRMNELGIPVNQIKVGMPAQDSDRYINIKAENFYGAGEWVKDKKNHLEPHEGWNELAEIRYKEDSSNRLKIQPKEEMKKKRGVQSPNVADAFMLTFSDSTVGTAADLL